MRRKKNRYIAEAVKEMIKIRDLKPAKDAKGGYPPDPCGPGRQGRWPAQFHEGSN
jgi:hypothetical protein